MDKVDETRLALCEFLRQPIEAGTMTVWPGIDRMIEGLALIDAYALAWFDLGFAARLDCSTGRYGAPSPAACAHHGGQRVCRAAKERARLEELAGPTQANVLTREHIDDLLQKL